MKTCFFIGHHDAPLTLQEELDAVVMHLVKMCDVTAFIVGHYGNFDRMATIAVQRVKKQYPNIYAFRLLPYFPTECSLPIPECFDDTYYPEGLETVPKRFSIEKANQAVLDESDYLVVYVSHSGGNAAKLLRRAVRIEKKGYLCTINLYHPAKENE